LAANGFGVWSLVYGQMAAAVLTTALYWWAARSRISFGLDRDEARTLIGFGLPVTAVTLLAFAIYNVDYLAIGIRLGDEQLGLYTLAYRLPELVILNLCVVVSEVLFSALSRLQQDRSQLVTHYLQAVVAVMALTTPVGVALAIAAPAVIETLYGPSYSAAAPALTLLSVYAVVYSASFHAGDVFKAINKPSILTAISALKLILMIGPIWWAAGRSIVLVATALVLVECVQFAVRMVIVSKVAAVPATRLLKSILRPAPAAAGMAAVMVLVEHISVSMPGPAVLAVTVSAGLLAYVAGLWLTAPQLVGGALAGLRSLRDRHSAEASTQPFAVPPSSRAVGADRCWVQRKRWP
jgi:lipopolysaccharide exporter